MPIEFINADLEITSSEDLEPIRMAFAEYGGRFAEMSCAQQDTGSYFASFEVHPDEECDDHSSEEKIHAFCDSISKLQGLPRDVWDRATKRVIDLGYQADDQCSAFRDHLPTDALERMTKLGIEVALTIYPQTIQNAEQTAPFNL